MTEQENQAKKSVGKTKENSLKKGNTSWKPAALNEFRNKEDGFRYRMARKDPDNINKKVAEGWETVSDLTSPSIKQEAINRIEHGAGISSVQEGHDWILMRMPEEVALQRDAYWNGESERRVSGLTSHIKKDLAKEGVAVHGDITISSRNGH